MQLHTIQNRIEGHAFPVELQNVFTKNGAAIKGARAVVRTDSDEPLSIVSDRYRLITHQQSMDLVSPLMKSLGPSEGKGYIEKNGARYTLESTYRQHTQKIRKVGDTVALRVNVTNSYDTTQPLTITVGAMVLRCLNGLMIAGASISLFVKHVGTDDLDDLKLPEPDRIFETFKSGAQTWERWAETDVTKDARENLYQSLTLMNVISGKQLEDQRPIFDAEPTWWTLYDRFTYRLTHEHQRVRNSERNRRRQALDYAFALNVPKAA